MEIIKADLLNHQHAQAFLTLTAVYMADDMGGGKPWTEPQKQKVIADLRTHPSCMILLARNETDFVGVCTCFYGYSTFMAGGLINIHDIFVDPTHRGKGIGCWMLREVERLAREKGVAKITLEVRFDNRPAQVLYLNEGYTDPEPPMMFWTKYLTP